MKDRTPNRNTPRERLYRRLIEEFPQYAEQMKKSDIRPKSERKRRGQWSWYYQPSVGICVGSPWSMTEVLKEKNWIIYEHGSEISILIYQKE